MAADEPTPIEPEPERPEWLPEKFKTPEELARSYGEVEKEAGRLRSELGTERSNFAETLARIEAQGQQRQQEPAYNPSTDPMIVQYGQALEAGDYAQAMMIQAVVNSQTVATVIDEKMAALKPALSAQEEANREVAFTMAQNRVSAEYGERWEELQPQVFKMLNDRPHWMPQVPTVEGYASVLKEAAQVVESERIVRENAAAERDRLAKLNAQGITGNTSRAPLTGEAAAAAEQTWADVQNAPTGGYGNLIRS